MQVIHCESLSTIALLLQTEDWLQLETFLQGKNGTAAAATTVFF